MFLMKVHHLKLLVILDIIKMNQVNQNVNNALQVGHNGRKVKPVVMLVEAVGINQVQVKNGALKLVQDIIQELLLKLQELHVLSENINQVLMLQAVILALQVNIKIKQVNQVVNLAQMVDGQMRAVLLAI